MTHTHFKLGPSKLMKVPIDEMGIIFAGDSKTLQISKGLIPLTEKVYGYLLPNVVLI